jgi:hypothetical protein
MNIRVAEQVKEEAVHGSQEGGWWVGTRELISLGTSSN